MHKPNQTKRTRYFPILTDRFLNILVNSFIESNLPEKCLAFGYMYKNNERNSQEN